MADYNEVLSFLPYFGNIEWYAHLFQQDMLVDIHSHYEKQSFRNRCELASSQGRITLSLPVHRPSGVKTPFQKIQVSYAEDWRHDHTFSVNSTYRSSPFFIHYWDEIQEIWKNDFKTLMEWNVHVHKCVMKLLQASGSLVLTESYMDSTPGKDLRELKRESAFENERYIQVFEERIGFQKNLSILDLLFCLGPETIPYLRRQKLG